MPVAKATPAGRTQAVPRRVKHIAAKLRAKALLLRSVLLAICLLTSAGALAQVGVQNRLVALVVIPESSGPVSVIYDKVVKGIESNGLLEVTRLSLPKDAELAWLQQRVDEHAHQLVIAVGNQSYRLCAQLETPSTLVAGGISGKPNGIPTLSLTGDPDTTLRQLKLIAPDVTDVRLVYNEPMNGWWYEQAVAASTRYGLSIKGYRAENLKEGVKLYERMVEEASPKTTAIWIPLRSIVPSKTILPFLLEKAWAKKLPVVSNNPSHTKLGGLMALYPEHETMGAQLAQFAIAHHSNNATEHRITGTRQLRLAVNLRTGAHIGLRFSTEDRQTFDKTFPQGR